MAASKPKSQTVGQVPSRTASHTRFKSLLQRSDTTGPGSSAPSTLPPPPFQSEAAVVGLEWWLDAHMALAAELLCLEQLVDAMPEAGAHGETIRRLTANAEAVRDALYELYCDAADDRMAPLLGRGAALEMHVRGSYAWCARVVGLLATVTNGLRDEAGQDWAAVKAGYRESVDRFVAPPEALREGARALPIDFTSPIEPLRNLPQDLEQLFASMLELQTTLTKRFG
jgi:hypothetical protein